MAAVLQMAFLNNFVVWNGSIVTKIPLKFVGDNWGDN